MYERVGRPCRPTLNEVTPGASDINFNDVLAFLIEIAALVAIGVWGFRTGSSPLQSWLLGLGAPAVAIVLWGLFAAPRAVYDVFAAELAVKTLVLGGGVLAAFTFVPVGWAIAFAFLMAANTLLVYVGPLAG